MGKYDVTLAQYVAFLNSVATKSDPYGLYYSGMATDQPTIAISRSGVLGNYSYAVAGSDPQAANCPAFDINWEDAARFCNWLQNGQPTGGTEATGATKTGAYALDGATTTTAIMAVTRSSTATFVIPTVNEWYKAAYYVSGSTNAGYWAYPTRSDTAPSNSLALALSSSNDANYRPVHYTDPTNFLTPVGAFVLSSGPYGTYDMGGDVYEWNEEAIYQIIAERGLRGGSYYDNYLTSSDGGGVDPTICSKNNGFRVASLATAAEPSTLVLLAAGAVGLVGYRSWQRRFVRVTAKQSSLDQHEALRILSFPSRSSTKAAHRAA
jgi:formylglycine-generating enzyme